MALPLGRAKTEVGLLGFRSRSLKRSGMACELSRLTSMRGMIVDRVGFMDDIEGALGRDQGSTPAEECLRA